MFDLISSAHAMGSANPAAGGGPAPNPILQILPFLLMFVVLYLLILRPQMKKQKAHQRLIDELEKGDEIVTTGGIHGTVVSLKDDVVVVKIADNVKVDLSRAAVARVKNKETQEAK